MRRALGGYFSEPKAHVIFDATEGAAWGGAFTLDRRTRMLYDAQHVFVNGESFSASGRDAQLMRKLADARVLDAAAVKRLSGPARALLVDWCEAGWIHVKQ